MRVPNRGRRHFLMGAGGFSLALPLLPSLLPRRAQAGDYPYAEHPRFVAFATDHGGIWGENMYPGDETLSGTDMIYPGHEMNFGALSRADDGTTASLSPVLSAPSSVLTDSLVAKMNVLRGLDITFYIAHHYAGHLGNYGRPGEDGLPPLAYRPTIDQVMHYSDSFYPDISQIRARSMLVGLNDLSWSESQSGSVDPVPRSTSSLQLFNQIFDPKAAGPDELSDRTPVVDRVLEHYQSLRSGSFGEGKRLSAVDRARLDDHMERLFELQTRLSTQLPASCADVPTPTGDANESHPGSYAGTPEENSDYYQLYNDVIAAAFICGTSRVATVSVHQIWNNYVGDWHQEIAHEAHGNETAQNTQVATHRSFFEEVFLDLAQKLDVEEDNGLTVLDNSLLMWSQESGIMTHDSDSMPVVTAGSAAGYFETGQFLDYRDRTNMALTGDPWTPVVYEKRPGIAYNRWLANVLQSMNIGPEEYGTTGDAGYGVVHNENTTAWPDRIYEDADDPLPHLVAT